MSETTTSTTPLPSLPTTISPTSTSTTSTTPTTPTTSTSSETSTTSTTSPISTTSSTTSSSISTSTTTSSSTTSTTSSTSSSTEAATSSSTSSSSTTASSTSLSTLTSTGDDQTSTVVVTATGATASTSQSAVSDSTSGGKSFFDNKGAVAGVFTVVGLVALVLFVVVATNVIRRRRAKKFDEEVAAAAAEANASTRYPFDDYDDPAPGGGYGTYSDPESHGTLSQAPLTHTGESYNMSEFNGGYGPSYATGTAAGAAAGAGAGAGTGAGLSAGAAGIGASRSLARRSTNPHGDYTAPYNAFAGPLEGYPSDPYDPYTAGNIGIRRQGSRSGAEFLDAVGIGAAGATGAAALNRGPSQNTQNPAQSLDRNQSQTTQHSGGNANSGGTTQESYAAHYQPDFRPNEHQYQPPLAAAPPSAGDALPNPFARDGASDEDAYGGEIRSSSPHDETRMSIRDEEDYGRAGRTLKVANE